MKQLDNIIATLQQVYNVLVVFNRAEPEHKRIFISNSFIPVQNNIHYLDIRGQEITEILNDGSFYTQFSLGRQTGISDTEFQKAQMDSKLDNIPIRHYQFSPDFSWEWHLSS